MRYEQLINEGKFNDQQVFMTDDAAAYWNAFEATMQLSRTKRLLCTWHVDRSWRKKLKELIRVPSDRLTLYLPCNSFAFCGRFLIRRNLN